MFVVWCVIFIANIILNFAEKLDDLETGDENENPMPMEEKGTGEEGVKKMDILKDGDMIRHIQGRLEIPPQE